MTDLVKGDCWSFRDDVLDYLRLERDLIRQAIDEHKALDEESRESLGLLIRSAVLIEDGESEARYATPNNLTKLRPGDEVRLVDVLTGASFVAYVDENDIEEMSFTFESSVAHPAHAMIVVEEINTLDQVIARVSAFRPGAPGLGYLRVLAGLTEPRKVGFGAIDDVLKEEIPSTFNDAQREAVLMAAKRPEVCHIQGTPGSGKTHLLAVVAGIFSRRGRDVVVVALTHQAVNNALNKIVLLDEALPVVKIGKPFKNIGLDERVVQATGFREYLAMCRERDGFMSKVGSIVGMTFQSALTNLCEIKSAFVPQTILFDEAGQLPLTHGLAVGAFRCGSVVFVGDDAQMPPIYQSSLVSSPLSVSLFAHVKKRCPATGVVLNTTYRMCRGLADFVSRRYYEPMGVTLTSAESAAGNLLIQSKPQWLRGDCKEIEFVECQNPGACDENLVEARAVACRIKFLIERGLLVDRLAVITPYRRQVRLILKVVKEYLPKLNRLPLIDTVERLQGQDVDVLLASFATDSIQYGFQNQGFIKNPNRLNVTFSRATSRVVVFGSELIRNFLGL